MNDAEIRNHVIFNAEPLFNIQKSQNELTDKLTKKENNKKTTKIEQRSGTLEEEKKQKNQCK